MNDKLRKLLIVAFLTIFIWVWAFNELEKDTQQSVTLKIASPANPDKLVSFEDLDSPANILLKVAGPASKIDKLQKDIDNGKVLIFSFNVIDDKQFISSDNVLNVLEFMKDRARAELPEFTIESATPSTIKVIVEDLVVRPLKVMVVDQYGSNLGVKSIKPDSIVNVYVKKGASEGLMATVRLTEEEEARARSTPITKTTVYIGDEPKLISTELIIELPPTEQILQRLPFKPKFVGLAMSTSMQGKYKVELDYDPEHKIFMASEEAMAAYKAEAPYQIIIEIAKDDWKLTEDEGDITRQVIYKFPEMYVKIGEIRLADDQEPDFATFKVTRIEEKNL